MKLLLCTVLLLFAVQLCSTQRTSPKEECQSGHYEGDYGKEREFYYQGRDHYYPGRGSYSDRDYRGGSYPRKEFSYQGQDYHYQRFPFQHGKTECRYSSYSFEYFHSCWDILYEYPETPSGFYYIASGPDHFRKVYCEMEKEFCGSKGWEKFYYMDFMKNKSHKCPEPFSKGYRSKSSEMGKQYYCEGTMNDSCTTARFSLDGVRYSEICAKIGGYQYGLPTAFKPYEEKDYDPFMDGVYFSYGKDTKYLWGYAVGSYKHYHSEDRNTVGDTLSDLCPDVHPKYEGKVPPFVGDYYYCDSGAYKAKTNDSSRFFYEHRLFEGKGCEHPNYTCMRSGQPWFYRKLPVYFNDYIEMSSCNGDKTTAKGMRMDNIEIYLR